MRKLSHACRATLASRPLRRDSNPSPVAVPPRVARAPPLPHRRYPRAPHVVAGARSLPRVLAPVCAGVCGGPATPLTPPHPLPQSLGTSGAGRRGLGGNEEERTMEGKPREGLRKETPAPCRWSFCGSVTCLPAPWPLVLGGGVSPGLCVTLVICISGGDCRSPWAPDNRRPAGLLVTGMPSRAGAHFVTPGWGRGWWCPRPVLGTPGATVPHFPVPAHRATLPDCLPTSAKPCPRAAQAP